MDNAFEVRLRKNKGGKSKPSFCVAFQHGSRILWILARVSQPSSGHGQPLPRRVCACDALYRCVKMHVHHASMPAHCFPVFYPRLAVPTHVSIRLSGTMALHNIKQLSPRWLFLCVRWTRRQCFLNCCLQRLPSSVPAMDCLVSCAAPDATRGLGFDTCSSSPAPASGTILARPCCSIIDCVASRAPLRDAARSSVAHERNVVLCTSSRSPPRKAAAELLELTRAFFAENIELLDDILHLAVLRDPVSVDPSSLHLQPARCYPQPEP